jgi:ribosome biogenesis GTPase / thiamine phosphate phosphatase
MATNSSNTNNKQSNWTKEYLDALNKKIAEAKQLQKQVNEKKPVIKETGSKQHPEKKPSGTPLKKNQPPSKDNGIKPKESNQNGKNRKPFKQEIKPQDQRSVAAKNKTQKPRTLGGNITFIELPFFNVLSGNVEYRCKPASQLNLREPLLVGDRVHISLIPEKEGLIEKIEGRQNTVVNPNLKNQKQENLIAANINQIVMVVSAKEPVLRTDWLDRHLVLCERKGYKPVLCCTKIDLADDNQFIDQMDGYKRLGYKVIYLSSIIPSNVTEFKQLLKNKTTLLTGHAGVGKTTLIQQLRRKNDRSLPDDPENPDWSLIDDYEATKAVRAYYLDGGGMVIDSPGIQEYELYGIPKRDLKKYFREFRPLNPVCSLPTCFHLDEPYCAVRDAVTKSTISQDRYDSYLKILESLNA